MRWKFVVGFGFAGAIAGSALGQFAVDRPQTQSAPQSGLPGVTPQQPVQAASTGAYTPPVGGLMPAGGLATGPVSGQSNYTQPPARPLTPPPTIEVESSLGPNHEWAIKAETGPYFILVKSYSRPHVPTPEDNGPSARALAEMLAGQIREKHKVQAFLYEHISDERKAEAAAIAAERERGRLFAQQMNERKQQAELQGSVWLDHDTRIRFKTVNYRDQIAVLIGPFNTDLDARKAIDIVRKWEAPEEKILKDAAVVGRLAEDGKNARIENGYLNPYMSATVVPNPLIPKQVQPVSTHCDPFIVKLNDGCPYNLFKATKSWTLAIKSFNAPVEIVSKDVDPSVMRKDTAKKGANALQASAVQAEAMAKMLREMKDRDGKSLGFEAFVLHTRHSSVVTIGQYDSPDDPALQQTQNLLKSIKLNVSEDKMGVKQVGNAPTLFDAQSIAMPIPKA
jgi:hypothetical protein